MDVIGIDFGEYSLLGISYFVAEFVEMIGEIVEYVMIFLSFELISSCELCVCVCLGGNCMEK